MPAEQEETAGAGATPYTPDMFCPPFGARYAYSLQRIPTNRVTQKEVEYAGPDKYLRFSRSDGGACTGTEAEFTHQGSPAKPFFAGRAGLVFVSPHVVDAGQDNAVFGWLEADNAYGGSYPHPPHEQARTVAWFRPPIASRKYLVEFVCRGFSIEMHAESPESDTFNLVNSLDASSVSTNWNEAGERHLAVLIEPPTKQWLSLTLSATNYWRLSQVEITALA